MVQQTISIVPFMKLCSDKKIVAETVDASGLKCPEPVMMLRNALRKADTGTCLKLIATDPSTLRDVPTMCRFMHHELVSQEEREGFFEFVVSARGAKLQP